MGMIEDKPALDCSGFSDEELVAQYDTEQATKKAHNEAAEEALARSQCVLDEVVRRVTERAEVRRGSLIRHAKNKTLYRVDVVQPDVSPWRKADLSTLLADKHPPVLAYERLKSGNWAKQRVHVGSYTVGDSTVDTIGDAVREAERYVDDLVKRFKLPPGAIKVVKGE